MEYIGRRKTVLMALGVIIIAASAIFLFSEAKSGGEIHKVELTPEGYKPRELIIQRGDVIEFSSQLGEPHWPASDIHPTHDLYSDFDPQEPVDHNQPWSFQFNEAGEYTFHDHLAPRYRGKVTVVD